VDRHTGDDALAWSVHYARSSAAWPTRSATWPSATCVIAHRIERELFERLVC
jgi:hypothetical protein